MYTAGPSINPIHFHLTLYQHYTTSHNSRKIFKGQLQVGHSLLFFFHTYFFSLTSSGQLCDIAKVLISGIAGLSLWCENFYFSMQYFLVSLGQQDDTLPGVVSMTPWAHRKSAKATLIWFLYSTSGKFFQMLWILHAVFSLPCILSFWAETSRLLLSARG